MKDRGATLLLDLGIAGCDELVASDALVVLAKPAGITPPNIAWLAVEPRPIMTIAWDSVYGVFASQTGVRVGTTVNVSSMVYPAVARRIYTFDGARFAEARREARVPRGHYDVWNAGPSPMTFGIVQNARIDGQLILSPLNAVVLPTDFTADFTPDERVYIWAQSGVTTSVVIRDIPREAAMVTFGRQRLRTYRFDTDTSRFVSSP